MYTLYVYMRSYPFTFQSLDGHRYTHHATLRVVHYCVVDDLEGTLVKQLLKEDAVKRHFSWTPCR